MTFSQRYERPQTITRKAGRAPSTRISDGQTANQPVAKPLVFSAPVMGLVLDVDVASIPDGGAALFENWYATEDGAEPRGGSLERNTGLGGEVLSIVKHDIGVGSKAFAITASSVFDVTAPGAVGAAVVTGLSAGVWSSVNFTTSGGSFLIMVAGGNGGRKYDGTTWTAFAPTGMPGGSTMSQVWSYANRIFVAQSGSTDAWYLATDAIAGAAIKFPLGGEFQSGGKLLAGGTWSSDAGDNPRSMCVFASTEGDIVVYEGADPASWSKRSSYKIARPLGPNCFFRTGGDLAIMTEGGLFLMSQITGLDAAILSREAVSKRIRPLWRDLVADSTAQRWQMIRRDPRGQAFIVPIKAGAGASKILVTNMETGAWSPWSGWAPTCIQSINGDLVFGTVNGRIVQGDVTGSDEGSPYSCALIGQYQMAGAQTISARMARAIVRTADLVSPRVGVAFDYRSTLPAMPNAVPGAGVSVWDGADWDAGVWFGDTAVRQVWQAVTGRGWAAAPVVLYTFAQAARPDAKLLRTDILFEQGEMMS